ncbi:hypothetical protein C9374_012480 [Naegleria lovaniensis]|uniref:Uncharacterized protein n=1 Tax=Naegleria lovaniensis TaxID=51637 RepID=A0AA88KNL2_NAELO|nr:uncharacterized protein C9374_012480 [Naegleria lovaniensis]KAG2392228.1 hypothetical protein C9374_012480 [Naegleria lovaniensis]
MNTASSQQLYQDVTILTKDKYLLSARVYEPSTTSAQHGNKKTAIVGSAIGVKMNFYHDFACFLQHNGYRVVLFDYRGCYESRNLLYNKYNQHLPPTDLISWGKFDIPSVIDYVEQLDLVVGPFENSNKNCDHSNTKESGTVMSDIVFIAHSISGKSICFTPKKYLEKISAMVCVASQSGNFTHQTHILSKMLFFFVCYLFCPVMTPMVNTLPIWTMPSDCAKQCAQCGRYSEEVFGAFPKETIDLQQYLNCPVLFYALRHDILGDAAAVKFIFNYFTNNNMKDYQPLHEPTSKIGHRDYRTVTEVLADRSNLYHFLHHFIYLNRSLGKRLGHFGFFKKHKGMNSGVWHHLLTFIDNAVERKRRDRDSSIGTASPDSSTTFNHTSLPPLRHSKL